MYYIYMFLNAVKRFSFIFHDDGVKGAKKRIIDFLGPLVFGVTAGIFASFSNTPFYF